MRLQILIFAVTTLSLSQALAADAPAWPAGACIYRDSHYSIGAVVCVAPHYGQTCGKDGGWTEASNDGALKDACASAQIATNPTPPAPTSVTCAYHAIAYSPGSTICVAPHFGQSCVKNDDGKDAHWSPVSNDAVLKNACANAQIPAPTGPPAPSGK